MQMMNDLERLKSDGYVVLKDFFDDMQVANIKTEYLLLEANAKRILEEIASKNMTYNDYYDRNRNSLIVVGERNISSVLCRFENILPVSNFFRLQILPQITDVLTSVMNEDVVIFKDKCNLKYPGGGQFSPHQDIPAYINFGPNYFLTAAVFINETTAENGALEFCSNFSNMNEQINSCPKESTPFGFKTIFEYESGGINNGKILDRYEDEMLWELVRNKPNDLVVFDSYVPHKSSINMSVNARSVFFFTFCSAKYEDIYKNYYDMKRSDGGNPIFHIATPTKSDAE